MKRRKLLAALLTAALVVTGLPAPGGTGSVKAAEPTPVTETKTFPVVKEYTSNIEGKFSLGTGARFFIVHTGAYDKAKGVADDVKLISSEFAAKGLPSGETLPIILGLDGADKAGDIVLKLVESSGYPVEGATEEAYTMEISDRVTITSPGRRGLFYGMRTLLKMLIGNDGSIRKGTIKDQPEVPVRSFHLDMARKYFTKNWIIKQIKDLSFQGYNSIQLHFSENEGFRLQSETLEREFPGFKYPNTSEYMTKEQMKEVIQVANRYNMEVVPSFDTPGHLRYVLNQISNLTGEDYSNSALFPGDSRRNQSFNIFTNEKAKTLLNNMIEEYAKFFSENGCKHMNIGGDEFLANFHSLSREQYQIVMDHFNNAAATLRKYGMTARVWNDGVMLNDFKGINLDPTVEVAYWGLAGRSGNGPYTNESCTAQTYFDNGNKVINYRDNYMYYVLGSWWMSAANPSADKIYNEWHPGKLNSYYGTAQDYEPPFGDKILGFSYAIWCDSPYMMNENQISGDQSYREGGGKGDQKGMFYRSRASVAKGWNIKGNTMSYNDFKAFMDKLGRVPGYDGSELPQAKEIVDESVTGGPTNDTTTLSGNQLLTLTNPFLREYNADPSNRLWKLPSNLRLVLPKEEPYLSNARLREISELVSAEYLAKGIVDKDIEKLYVERGSVRPTDILITMDSLENITTKTKSDEAYKIEIGENGVKITAASTNGVLYALRSIGNMMLTNDKSLVFGTIIDYPDLLERRLHVDCGRKFFTKDWFIQTIRQLSYLKFNALQMHFAENLGFRIECETDPQIVSKDGYLTKAEVREILAEARKYGVKIIPSLDTPGHTEHILKFHPEYGALNSGGYRSTTAWDVTNPVAVQYLKNLYTEYMDLFEGCTDFHIGADEYMEFDRGPFKPGYMNVLNDYAKKTLGSQYNWKDVLATYINDIAAHVYARGFKPRIWNDGIYYGQGGNYYSDGGAAQKVKIHPYIGVDFWSQMGWNRSIAKLNTFFQKGHKDIYNVNATYFYYVLRPQKPNDGREQHSFDHLNQDKRIYETWSPGIFESNTVQKNSPYYSYIKGVSMAIWCDKPDLVGEDVVTSDITTALRSLGTKGWDANSNEKLSYENFKKVTETLGNAPGFEKGSSLPAVAPFDGGVLPPAEDTYTVNFTKNPEDLKLSVRRVSDSRVYLAQEDGSYKLPVGTFEYTASKEGYDTKKETFEVTEDDSTHTVVITLVKSLPKGAFLNPILKMNSVITNPSSYWTYTAGGRRYPASNMFDVNDSTYAWWAHPNEHDTYSEKGDWIGYDLGKLYQLGRIHLTMGGTSSTDHWSKYRILYSTDKMEWHEAAPMITQDTATKTTELYLKDQNIKARYVVIENNQRSESWVQISEFDVETIEIPEVKYAVTISTNPAGATVRVFKGISEILPQSAGTWSLSEGSYNVIAELKNYETYNGSIRISDDVSTHTQVLTLTQKKSVPRRSFSFREEWSDALNKVQVRVTATGLQEGDKLILNPGDSQTEFGPVAAGSTSLDLGLHDLHDGDSLNLKAVQTGLAPSDAYTVEVSGIEKANGVVGFYVNDDEESPLTGVTVSIYNALDDLQDSVISVSDSPITANLPYGTYTAKVTGFALKGYLATDEVKSFTVKAPTMDNVTLTVHRVASFFELTSLYGEVKDLDLTPYTEDTAEAFRKARDEAKKVLDLPETQKDEVYQNALDELKTRKEALLEKPKDNPPAAVTNLRVRQENGEIVVEWNAAETAEKYDVFGKKPGEEKMSLLGETDSLNYRLTPETNGYYYFRVYATRMYEGRKLSSESTVYVYTYVRPEIPAALTELRSEEENMTVTLSWDSVPNADAYEILRRAPGEKEMTTLAETTELSFTDKTEKIGYHFYIVRPIRRADDKVFYSANKVYATEFCRPSLPKMVQNLTLSTTGNRVNLKWDASEGAEYYIVLRRAPGEDKMTQYRTVVGTSFRDRAEKDGYHFYIVIPVVTKNGYFFRGEATPYQTIYVNHAKREAVKGLRIKRDGTYATLTWKPMENVEGYLIYRQGPADQGMKYLYMKTTESYTDKLTESGEYTYTVRAFVRVDGKIVAGDSGRTVHTNLK